MIEEHWSYVSDFRRTELYRQAIAATVKPGDRVLDLGCGVGIFGALCLAAGAGEVVAVDRTSIVEVARQVFDRAGHGARSRTVRGTGRQLEFDRPFDLIVCDHVGYFALDYGIADMLADAARRMLAPGGRLMPRGVTLFAAPVASEACAKAAFGWSFDGVPEELRWLRRFGVNSKHGLSLRPEDVVGSVATLGAVDFAGVARDAFSFRGEATVARDGEVHGIAGFFEAELSDSVRMTNSPLAEGRIDRPQAFLPLAEPLAVRAGDRLEIAVTLRPEDSIIAWTVRHPASGRRFRHSTLESTHLSTEALQRARPDHRPRLTSQAAARAVVLGYCDGERTVREIEAAVRRDHPDLLPAAGDLARFVSATLQANTE